MNVLSGWRMSYCLRWKEFKYLWDLFMSERKKWSRRWTGGSAVIRALLRSDVVKREPSQKAPPEVGLCSFLCGREF